MIIYSINTGLDGEETSGNNQRFRTQNLACSRRGIPLMQQLRPSPKSTNYLSKNYELNALQN